MKRIFSILLLLCISQLSLNTQNAWQWTKKLGCNTAYNFDMPQVLKTLIDAKGNQYIVYYITGDTFYYGDTYKRYIAGGDGYALCRVRCDGSLSWCKIITHSRKNKADLTPNEFNTLFFGKDENTIVFSSNVSGYGNTYIDNDTTLDRFQNAYTIIYDSTGIARKKIVNKSNQQGLSFASGYFPRTNQYVNGAKIDSTATNRVFFNGKYLRTGEYLAFLDTNFNYTKLVPIVTLSKSFAQWDSTQPGYLGLTILPNCQIFGTKLLFESSADFNPTSYVSPLLTPKFLVIGRDTIRSKDLPTLDACIYYTCYNDTGYQEWTRFIYPNAGTSSNAPSFSVLDKKKKEISIMRDETGSWRFQNQNINSIAPNGNYQTNIFKIDSNGNFLWQKGIEHDALSSAMYYSLRTQHNSNSELIINLALQSAFNGTNFGIYINGKRIQDNINGRNIKNILVAVSKDTIRLIDTNTDATRNSQIYNIVVDPSDNIYIHGKKTINGCILNGDSSAIQYGVGFDNFIAKYGQSNCSCDPIHAAFQAIDSTTEGKITLQYSGLHSDSVLYRWGDGTSSIAKPATTPITKIYNQTKIITIQCISYNNCNQSDTFKKTYSIYCKPLASRMVLTDSNFRTITALYTGSNTDSVLYLWGDGTSTIVTNPSTKATTHIYTSSATSYLISTIIHNGCGQYDTFRKTYTVYCPPLTSRFAIVDSNVKSITVAYTGSSTDSVLYLWGDGNLSWITNPSTKSVPYTYTISADSVLISAIIHNPCGRADTMKRWYIFCKRPLINVVIDSSLKQSKKISIQNKGTTSDSFSVDWGDGTTSTSALQVKIYSVSGRYNIRIRVKNMCGASDSIVRSIYVGTSSIASSNFQKNIKIYPNPTNDKITVEHPDNLYLTSEVYIVDMLGIKIPINLVKKGKNIMQLDVSLLPTGNYILWIENEGYPIAIER